MIEAKGTDGHVSFDGTLVTIQRGGGALRAWRTGTSSKSIPAWAIAGVELVPAGLGRGSIGFVVRPPEGTVVDPDAEPELLDEHTVAFSRSQQSAFEEVQRQVKAAAFAAASAAAREERTVPMREPVGAPASAAMRDLRKLGELYQAGIVTPDEFERAKARLLDQI
jgi:hypothetical protein